MKKMVIFPIDVRNSYQIWGSHGSEDSYCDLQGYDYFFNIMENLQLIIADTKETIQCCSQILPY